MTKPIDWLLPDHKHTEAIMRYVLKQGYIKKPKQLTKTMYLQCTHCNDTIHSSYSGDYVTFRSNQPKDLTRNSPVKYNIPLCLWGLHVNTIAVDRHTEFRVKYVSSSGFIIEVDEFKEGLFFMKNRLQWSSSPIVSESVVNKLSDFR